MCRTFPAESASGGGQGELLIDGQAQAPVFEAGALAWGMFVDGFWPDIWDVIGTLACLAGVRMIMYTPRD